MILKQILPDGRYLVLTTRRANYTECIFGHATIYKSKKSYDKNDVLKDGYDDIRNISLGTAIDLKSEVENFVKGLTT